MSIAASAIGDATLSAQPGPNGRGRKLNPAPASRLIKAKSDLVAAPEAR